MTPHQGVRGGAGWADSSFPGGWSPVFPAVSRVCELGMVAVVSDDRGVRLHQGDGITNFDVE